MIKRTHTAEPDRSIWVADNPETHDGHLGGACAKLCPFSRGMSDSNLHAISESIMGRHKNSSFADMCRWHAVLVSAGSHSFLGLKRNVQVDHCRQAEVTIIASGSLNILFVRSFPVSAC